MTTECTHCALPQNKTSRLSGIEKIRYMQKKLQEMTQSEGCPANAQAEQVPKVFKGLKFILVHESSCCACPECSALTSLISKHGGETVMWLLPQHNSLPSSLSPWSNFLSTTEGAIFCIPSWVLMPRLETQAIQTAPKQGCYSWVSVGHQDHLAARRRKEASVFYLNGLCRSAQRRLRFSWGPHTAHTRMAARFRQLAPAAT